MKDCGRMVRAKGAALPSQLTTGESKQGITCCAWSCSLMLAGGEEGVMAEGQSLQYALAVTAFSVERRSTSLLTFTVDCAIF